MPRQEVSRQGWPPSRIDGGARGAPADTVFPQPAAQYQATRPARAPSADGTRVLEGVVALVYGDNSTTVLETVRAFGGRPSGWAGEGATHVLVPKNSDLGGQWCRQELEAVRSRGVPVVEVTWLEEVISGPNKSPWDQALLRKHEPATLAAAARAPAGGRWPSGSWGRRGPPATSSTAAPASFAPGVRAGLPRAASGSFRRTDQKPLSGSLAETWEFLNREHPEEVEAGQLRLAIERSLLDCALALRNDRHRHGGRSGSEQTPEEVLGVAKGASPEEVRAAYRGKAKAAHPDKGGDPGAFCRLQQAYLSLTEGARGSGTQGSPTGPLALPPAGASKDFELREHRSLVESWFREHGEDLDLHIAKQQVALTTLGLEACDVGSVNKNEKGQEMRNQCFYLSLARSYLGENTRRQLLEETALHFKRIIEAAVLVAHPDWGGQRVGEDVQAFSDFLFFVLESHALLSELSVAVFDSVSGGVEIYKGKHYPSGPKREAEQRANLLCICYVPGHYRALVPTSTAKRGPTLAELQARLAEHDVLYVLTDG